MPRVKWENGARCAVCLTFDVDGETVWMGRDPSLVGESYPQLHGAYGPRGIPRISSSSEIQPARRVLHPSWDGGKCRK